uniref:Uncharacterized protein n=1 Tax=Eptatretus burgeri TaxID=7764 RepID=A0A8C4Q5C1_EPTBU
MSIGLMVVTSWTFLNDVFQMCPEKSMALLKTYELTREGYHRRFRYIKPDEGETAFQFMTRFRWCFTQWTLMAKCKRSFEALTDLLVREQFLSVCSIPKEQSLSAVQKSPEKIQVNKGGLQSTPMVFSSSEETTIGITNGNITSG